MLTPYGYTAWDQGYKDAVAESFVEACGFDIHFSAIN